VPCGKSGSLLGPCRRRRLCPTSSSSECSHSHIASARFRISNLMIIDNLVFFLELELSNRMDYSGGGGHIVFQAIYLLFGAAPSTSRNVSPGERQWRPANNRWQRPRSRSHTGRTELHTSSRTKLALPVPASTIERKPLWSWSGFN
jgi:hypothetical protein